MRTTRHSRFRWLLVGISTLAVMVPAFAQDQGGGQPTQREAVEVASLNRSLKKSYFKTVNGLFVNLNTTWVNAFSDTLVQCPGTSGVCTVAVTVSSQFGGVTAAQVARARVLVNGVLVPPGDVFCCLNMSNNEGFRPDTAAMTFVANNVPFGNRLVQVQFSTSGGVGWADYRTLEIRVYKP